MNGDFESDDGYSEDDLPQSRSRSPSRSRSVSPLRDYSITTPIVESWMNPPPSSDPPVETVVEPPPCVPEDQPIPVVLLQHPARGIVLVQFPEDAGDDVDITMIKASRHTFINKRSKKEQWCYQIFNTIKWVQVRHSNIDHLRYTDARGKDQSAVQKAREMPDCKIKLGTGANNRCSTVKGNIDDDTHPPPPGGDDLSSSSRVLGTLVITDSPRRCIANVLRTMVSEDEYALLPLGDDLRLDTLPQTFRNRASFTLSRPVSWGFLRDHHHFNGTVDDLCTNAKITDRFILRVTLSETNTSLHCIGVMNRQIFDPSSTLGWLPLTRLLQNDGYLLH